MNKESVRQIRAALQAQCKLDGYTIEFGNASFETTSCTIKVRVVEGTPADQNRREWNQYAGLFGLSPEDYGRTVDLGGRSFTLAGLQLKARKAPIRATTPDGKHWKLEVDAVRKALGMAARPSLKGGNP